MQSPVSPAALNHVRAEVVDLTFKIDEQHPTAPQLWSSFDVKDHGCILYHVAALYALQVCAPEAV